MWTVDTCIPLMYIIYAIVPFVGQPKIWKVMKIMESVRLFAHHYPLGDKGETFRDYDELTKDCLIFLITSELVFNKEIYNLPDQNPWLRTKITGGYIGKSSLNSLTEIFTEDNDQILATNINQIVCIDKRDRRPMELAPWWREKYSESGKKHKPLTLEKYEKPPETCSYDTYVAWSDTDLNLHTNWTAYARFAVDAAHHCTKEGSLRNVADNISRGIYKVQFYFYGESVQGDRITVHLWEDSADPQVLMADMYNRGTSICQVRMTFH